MKITEYKSYYDVNGNVIDISWEDFVKRISQYRIKKNITLKNFRELPRLGKGKDVDGKWEENQTNIKSAAGGAVYGEMIIPKGKPAGRGMKYFQRRSAISLDLEDCKENVFQNIKDGLVGYKYCYYTTCKCKIPNDIRLRIIIPFNKDVDWKIFALISVLFSRKMKLEPKINDDDKEHEIDTGSFEPERLMLYFVKLADNDFLFGSDDGNGEFLNVNEYLWENEGTVDIEEITKMENIDWNIYLSRLSGYGESKKKNMKTVDIKDKAEIEKHISGTSFIPKFMESKNESVLNRIKNAFNFCFSIREILDICKEYEFVNGRMYRYYKASGPGVAVSRDETKCYSFHKNSGDPLQGKGWVDCFNLYLMFKTDSKMKFSDRVKELHRFAIKEKGKKYEVLFKKKNYESEEKSWIQKIQGN